MRRSPILPPSSPVALPPPDRAGARSLPDWLALLEGRHAALIDLGLERIGQVWQRLTLTPSFAIISVAGTNGKGSTCAYLERMLAEGGYRVGLYTSPHLLRFSERVRVAGREADAAALVAALDAVEAVRGETRLTYFEHTTLAAMWLFCRQGVDVAVLEVGLGGRLDAVNLFAADCAIVTAVDLDHQEYLGTDRESIGFEKAGIFRRDRPAVCVDPDPPRRLLRHADAIGTPLLLLGRDIRVEVRSEDWLCQVGDITYPALPLPRMRGSHQVVNAAAALAALHTLRGRLPVALDALRNGLATAAQPGRFQIIGDAPLRILDVAHNPHAARALAGNLARSTGTGRCRAVFAMLRDKDIAGVITALAARVDHWHVAPLPGPRGATVADLGRRLTAAGQAWSGHANVAAAWTSACQQAGGADTIIVFGSFLTVAEVLALTQGPPDG